MTTKNTPEELLFLNEKFAPAELPEICAPRKVLIELFHRAAKEHFIYVGAPAGSGKTISTRLWLNASGRKTIWIGLDQYDDSPSVFFKLLSTGFYSMQPENHNMKQILTSPSFSASPVEHTIRLLSEFLWDDERYTLILDDMHLIQNGEILKALPAVLRRLPHSFVALILSRRQIPEELEPLIKNPEQNIITAEDLRFSEDEITRYFNSLGRILTPEESKFAYMATEGWAIGVNAVAKSGQINLDSGGSIFSHFFEEHLWSKWDDTMRDFCLRTCIVDEFDPALASQLSGRKNSQEIMEELSRTNTFLSRLHENIYRYHHLVLDHLRAKLETSKLDARKLDKIAANYYKERKDYSRALRFWLDSGDYKGIDTFLYLFLFENNRGVIADYADFLRTFFVKDFPKKAFSVFPPLHILCAWYTYLTSQRESFEMHMDAVYRNLPRIALADSRFVEYAILAYSVDHRSSILAKIKKFRTFGRYVKKFTPEGLATNIASFTHNLPYMHRCNLDYSDLALAEDSMEQLEGNFSLLLGEEWRYIKPGIPACFAYERNDLLKALSGITEAIDAMIPENKVEGRICVMIMHHTMLWQMQRQAEANTVLKSLSSLVESEAQFFIPNLKGYKTKLALFDCDKAAARTWMDEYFVIETQHVELFRVFQHFITARAYMVLGNIDKALDYLLMLKQFGQDFNRPLDAGEAGTLLASFYWATGRKKEALSALEDALETLQPYGFIRIVADEGASILPVLKHLERKLAGEGYRGSLKRTYVREVTLAAHAFSKLHKGVTDTLVQKDKPVRLSKQQTYMLTLLSQGYRNAEIAQITGLKIPTIKSHTSAAYKKLDVNNAMDAVLKARDLGFID